jgi:transcriptional regulator with XRE-family HTH domain
MEKFAPRHIMRPMAMDSPLRRWRWSQGLSQAELARRCGLETNTISSYEQGHRRPQPSTIDRLAMVTGLTPDALIYPKRYLEEHPEFLVEFAAAEVPKRGRPRKRLPRQAPERGQPPC